MRRKKQSIADTYTTWLFAIGGALFCLEFSLVLGVIAGAILLIVSLFSKDE